MNFLKKINFFLLRVGMGWILLYAGVNQVLDKKWSAKAYIMQAKTFTGFYNSLLTPSTLQIIDFVNKWGLTLIGISIILGLFVRFSAPFGAALMLLYYFPILEFPNIGKNYYIVDMHIIFALVFLLFAVVDAGKYWGLDYYRAAMRMRR